MDLSKVLTPEFLESLRKIQLPWREDQPLDWAVVANQFFGPSSNRKEWYDLTLEHAIKPISTIGVEKVVDIDFMQFLPSPETKDFPSKALGLLVLFDQAPRIILSGVNARYSNGYFDLLANKLVRQLVAIPEPHSPFSIERLMKQGWSFDYALTAIIWFTAPLVHSESMEDQNRQVEYSWTMRKVVEEHTGKTDPHRATMDEDSKDIYAFPRTLMKEMPRWVGTKIDEFMFWLLRVFLVHVPIIEKFGRYPYRNNALGITSTDEEVQYLEDTEHFGMLEDEASINKIREDVEAGIWSPLQNEPEFSGSGGVVLPNPWEAVMSRK